MNNLRVLSTIHSHKTFKPQTESPPAQVSDQDPESCTGRGEPSEEEHEPMTDHPSRAQSWCCFGISPEGQRGTTVGSATALWSWSAHSTLNSLQIKSLGSFSTLQAQFTLN